MKRIYFLLAGAACLAGTACFAATPKTGGAGAPNGCSAPVPLDLTGPRPILRLKIASGAEFPVILDTGAMGTAVDVGRATELGLANEGPLKPPLDRMGPTAGYSSTLRGASLGGIALPDTPISLLPPLLPGMAAVFSPAIFGNRLVRIDFAAGTLSLCPRSVARTLGTPTPYAKGDFRLPGVMVKVGTKTLEALVDTGSPMGLVFPTRFAETLPLAGPLVPAGKVKGHMGVKPLYKAQIKGRVQIGPLVLNDPEVRFADVVPMPNVGGPLLRRMVITLDPVDQRSWTQAAPGQLASPTGSPSPSNDRAR